MTVFKILLNAIVLLGYLYGIFNFTKNWKSIGKPDKIAALIKCFFWSTIPLTWLWLDQFHEVYPSFFKTYSLGKNFIWIILSLSSVFLATRIEKTIESKLDTGKKSLFYFFRVLIVFYIGVVMSITMNITRSTFYTIEITKYEKFDSSLDDIMESEKQKQQIISFKNINHHMKIMQRLSRNNDSIYSFKENSGFLSCDDNYDLTYPIFDSLKIKFTKIIDCRGRNVDILQYELELDAETQIVRITPPKFDKYGMENPILLKEHLQQKITSLKANYDNYSSNKPSFLGFTFSALSDQIGIAGYGFSPANRKTEFIDIFITIFYFLFTTVFIYEVSRRF